MTHDDDVLVPLLLLVLRGCSVVVDIRRLQVRTAAAGSGAVVGLASMAEGGASQSLGVGSAERSHAQRPSTAPLHDPQPVVARVASAMAATESAPARKAPTTAAFVTELQRQMTAVPGISARFTGSFAVERVIARPSMSDKRSRGTAAPVS